MQKEKAFLEKRFRELAERYAGRIPMWEVTNELLVSFRRGETGIFSAPDLVEWSFKTAERYFPASNGKTVVTKFSLAPDGRSALELTI